MAEITAAFNESDRTGPLPEFPVQILFDDGSGHPSFNVTRGTHLDVPVVDGDDSLPLLGDFPADVESRRQVRTDCYSQTEIGAVASEVIVDGNSVELAGPYTVGVNLDEAQLNSATRYFTSAAVIAPLSVGTHTVGIHFKASGAVLGVPPFDPWFPDGVFEISATNTVVVD
jgi:hypothetical protein